VRAALFALALTCPPGGKGPWQEKVLARVPLKREAAPSAAVAAVMNKPRYSGWRAGAAGERIFPAARTRDGSPTPDHWLSTGRFAAVSSWPRPADPWGRSTGREPRCSGGLPWAQGRLRVIWCSWQVVISPSGARRPLPNGPAWLHGFDQTTMPTTSRTALLTRSDPLQALDALRSRCRQRGSARWRRVCVDDRCFLAYRGPHGNAADPPILVNRESGRCVGTPTDHGGTGPGSTGSAPQWPSSALSAFAPWQRRASVLRSLRSGTDGLPCEPCTGHHQRHIPLDYRAPSRSPWRAHLPGSPTDPAS